MKWHVAVCIFQHHVDPSIGVYVIDRYTYYALEFLETVTPGSKKTMGQFVSQILQLYSILSMSVDIYTSLCKQRSDEDEFFVVIVAWGLSQIPVHINGG